jgi:hypothetical protein
MFRVGTLERDCKERVIPIKKKKKKRIEDETKEMQKRS